MAHACEFVCTCNEKKGSIFLILSLALLLVERKNFFSPVGVCAVGGFMLIIYQDDFT
jgi:hypothetical protein